MGREEGGWKQGIKEEKSSANLYVCCRMELLLELREQPGREGQVGRCAREGEISVCGGDGCCRCTIPPFVLLDNRYSYALLPYL